jgi:hypothetical protein
MKNYLIVTCEFIYLGLLCVKGRYRCLIMCLICRFIVIQNSVMKYMTRIGQNTGILNSSKNVQKIAIVVDFTIAYQNLNSGNRLMNGRNSSLLLVGSSGSSSTKIESNHNLVLLLIHYDTYTSLGLVLDQFSA